MYKLRLKNELKDIHENPPANCSAGPIDDNIMKWRATIHGPEDTPYEGGIFELKVTFTEEYPFKPPLIVFITPIYHCNINSRGGICLDILKDKWSAALTVNKILLSICALLSCPNPDDPLVPSIANLLKKNKDVHDANAREYTIRHAQ